MSTKTKRSSRRLGRRVAVLLFSAVLTTLLVAPSSASAERRISQREDVFNQGGDGLYRDDGARLDRRDSSLRLVWKVPTPTPETYTYPTPDQVPPFAPPHPPVTPGEPEVFTLWAFIFNNPELCSDPCDANDIGDTPAQGGVYQADSTIAHRKWIRMLGRFRVGQQPVVGVPLQSPRTAEVHVAMAPHGMALTGDDLQAQRSIPLGSPAEWWVAIFLTP